MACVWRGFIALHDPTSAGSLRPLGFYPTHFLEMRCALNFFYRLSTFTEHKQFTTAKAIRIRVPREPLQGHVFIIGSVGAFDCYVEGHIMIRYDRLSSMDALNRLVDDQA